MATKAPKGTVVEEDRRLFLRKQLEDFRDSASETLRFPANLSNIERRYVHKAVAELNLVSKSAGSGSERFITIWKRDAATAPAAAQNISNKTIPWELPESARRILSSAKLQAAVDEVQRELDALTTTGDAAKTKRHGRVHRLADQLPRIRASYAAAEAKRRADPRNAEMERKRASLPAAEHRADVVRTIQREQIVLVSGETGCGKSTQVPQFLLEDPSIGPGARIVITQPRRISAVSLAERIAHERCEAVGETVGYNIRMESKQSAQTQVLFVTPGVLLRKLLEDGDLDEFSHVIVDEAHERDRFTEFLLIVLRDIAARRASLKLVLMSATMHTQKLCAYFGDIPQINVGGSVFPVQEFFLEHVLKFIRYTPRSLAAATPTTTTAALAAASTFSCAVCHGGPFVSAEELGTHAALCFPQDADHFVSAYLQTRHVALPARTKAAKLDVLLQRLQWLREHVAPSATVAAAMAAVDGRAAATAAAAAAAAADDADAFDARFDRSARDEDGDDSDLDDDDFAALLLAQPGASTAAGGAAGAQSVGLGDRLLQSEESDELNALLKAYQRDLETAADEAGGSGSGGSGEVDYALIIALLRFVVSSEFGRDHGAVLVFLPGWDDIARLHRLLGACADFADPQRFQLHQLHSGVPRRDQQRVFAPVADPATQRKIILSTNIAETSVTIDDVSVVIDAMLMKEKAYDAHSKLSFLRPAFISQASARQRKGRAGRTRAGVCFRLCSVLRARHLREFQDSELLRMPLEELVLQAKALRLADGDGGAADFFAKALDPPAALAVAQAVGLLRALQCVAGVDEALTPLGDVLAQLPLSPRHGKMLLLGCVCGVAPAAQRFAAALNGRDPFLLPTSEPQRRAVQLQRQQFAGASRCDPLAAVNAVAQYAQRATQQSRGELQRWCLSHELSAAACQHLVDAAQQLDRSLRDVALPAATTLPVKHARCGRHEGSVPLATLALAAALYPDLAVRAPAPADAAAAASSAASLFVTERGAKAKLHPASINAKALARPAAALEVVCFQDLVALNAFHRAFRANGPEFLMLQTTPLAVLGLCVLCGSFAVHGPAAAAEAAAEAAGRVDCVVDGWLRLSLPPADARVVELLRRLLQGALMLLVRAPAALALAPPATATATAAAANRCDVALVTQTLDVALAALAAAQDEALRLHGPGTAVAPAAGAADAGRRRHK
eukprot:gene6659-4801_t